MRILAMAAPLTLSAASTRAARARSSSGANHAHDANHRSHAAWAGVRGKGAESAAEADGATEPGTCGGPESSDGRADEADDEGGGCDEAEGPSEASSDADPIVSLLGELQSHEEFAQDARLGRLWELVEEGKRLQDRVRLLQEQLETSAKPAPTVEDPARRRLRVGSSAPNKRARDAFEVDAGMALEARPAVRNSKYLDKNGVVLEKWRTTAMMEEYMDAATKMVMPNGTWGPFGYDPEMGRFPIEVHTALGYLLLPTRRPHVAEVWSPLEVSKFVAAIYVYGKNFSALQKIVQTKSVKECVEFFYIWKTTSHYSVWKKHRVRDLSKFAREPSGKGEGEDGRTPNGRHA
mmetsp:Transcript_636/g.2127  ORF Transcript_636/g.2127 Transcript_636/m.2127 type:complete len:349 (-) Transcript_636:43-1089(-)